MRPLSFAVLTFFLAFMFVPPVLSQDEAKPKPEQQPVKDEKQEPKKEEKKPEEPTLEETVVTATRVPRPVKDIPAAVTVVTRDEIENLICQDAASALEQLAGLRVTRYGGVGSGASVHFRGTAPRHALVMVDGRVVNSPSLGSADLAWIPVEDIERIEVVRGPYSALYGANALGGVINIITKKAPDEPYLKLSEAYGNLQTSLGSIEAGGKTGNFGAFGVFALRDTDGNRPHSDFTSELGNCALSYDFSGEAALSLTMGGYEDELEMPGARPASDPARRSPAQLLLGDDDISTKYDKMEQDRSFANCVFEGWGFKLTTGASQWKDQFKTMEIGGANELVPGWSRYYTDAFGSDLQYSHELGSWNVLTAGTSFKDDSFAVKSWALDWDVWPPASKVSAWDAVRKSWAFFLQDEIDLDPVKITLGGRWDDPSDYDSEFTFRGGIVWHCTEKVSLRTSYGESYAAPALNDLYWPTSSWAQGNPQLGTETARAYEIGVDHAFTDKTLWRLSLFGEWIDDMIAWAPTGPVGPWGNRWWPTNLNRAEIYGIETSIDFPLADTVDCSIGYTYLEANQTNEELRDSVTNAVETERRRLRAVPQHKVDFGLHYREAFGLEHLKLGMTVALASQQYMYYSQYAPFPDPSVSTATKRIAGYGVVDAKATYVMDWGNIFLSVENLLDKDYALQPGSDPFDRDNPMPGRTVMLGVELEFGKKTKESK